MKWVQLSTGSTNRASAGPQAGFTYPLSTGSTPWRPTSIHTSMGLLDMTGIGSLADLAKTAIQTIWPDKTEQEKQALANELAIQLGQLEINKAEAANASVFVSGWRPFIGWVCGAAFAANYVLFPIINWACILLGWHVAPMPPLNFDVMMPVLFGMLGLGAYRSFDKVKGTTK